MGRTYDRATWLQAKAAWDEGDFGLEWQPYREAMAERGWLWPPVGTRWDQREDEEPSQRAVIWRGITDRPETTLTIVRRSRNWSQVAVAVMQTEDRLREDIDLAEREQRLDDDEVRIGHRESVMVLAGVLKRIDDSRP